MAFVPAVNVAQVDMIYQQGGEACENVYHVLNTGAWDLTSLTALGELFHTWENGTMKSLRGATTQLNEIIVTDLTTQFGLQVASPEVPPIVGTGTAVPDPNNVTFALSWRTGGRGRSRRGRTFHIGMTEAWRVGNQINPASSPTFLTGYVALLTAVNGVSGHSLVVLSGQENKVKLNPRQPHAITFATIDPNLDSMRRRLPGHNRHH